MAKREFTNREKVLHRTLAEAAVEILTEQEMALLVGENWEDRSDIEAVIENYSQRKLRKMAYLLGRSCQRRMEATRLRAEEFNKQEYLALQLVWLCLGGGRSEKPPYPLPEKLDITLPPNIHKATAELIGNIAARAFPVGQSQEKVQRWQREFKDKMPMSVWFRNQIPKPEDPGVEKVALAAHEKIRKLEEEAERRETALNQLQMTNATLGRKIADLEQALKDGIRDFALDAIERIASKGGDES